MKYYKCTCKTTVHKYDLDELKGLSNEEFKNRLAEIIGGWCSFGHDSHVGRGFRKIESATKGNKCFDWEKNGDTWTFTATVICEDYEDYINADYTPYFDMTEVDYSAIRSCIEDEEEEKDSEPCFEEIEKVKEIHTYKLQDDWFLEIRLEREEDDSYTWMGYINRKGYDPMFVYGERLDQCTLYSNWQPYKVTLKEFQLSMYEVLYDSEAIETPFEQYRREINAIEADNWRMLNEINR